MTGIDLYDDFMYNSNTAWETLVFMTFTKFHFNRVSWVSFNKLMSELLQNELTDQFHRCQMGKKQAPER